MSSGGQVPVSLSASLPTRAQHLPLMFPPATATWSFFAGPRPTGLSLFCHFLRPRWHPAPPPAVPGLSGHHEPLPPCFVELFGPRL